MVGWWDADAVSGTTAYDIWDGNDGTLVNGATTAPGMVGQAFSLPGSASTYINVPNNASLNPTSAITVDAWINPTSLVGPYDPIVKKAGEGLNTNNGYALEFSSGEVTFWVFISGGSGWRRAPLGSVTMGVWSHVAGVYDGSAISLYVNGVLIGSTSVPGSIVPSSNPLQFGHDPSNPATRTYNGLIDEVEIFNRALSAAEIQAIYDAGSAGKCKDVSDLSVTKVDDPDPVIVGNDITYTIEITNNGPATATGVTLTDTLPAGTTFVSAVSTQGTCSEAGGTVTCDIGDLADGAVVTVTIVVTADTEGVITNTTTATTTSNDPDDTNDSDTEDTTVIP